MSEWKSTSTIPSRLPYGCQIKPAQISLGGFFWSEVELRPKVQRRLSGPSYRFEVTNAMSFVTWFGSSSRRRPFALLSEQPSPYFCLQVYSATLLGRISRLVLYIFSDGRIALPRLAPCTRLFNDPSKISDARSTSWVVAHGRCCIVWFSAATWDNSYRSL
jgi:hypothetical protein